MVDRAFREYREAYPARPPDASRIRSDDELREISYEEGLRSFGRPPMDSVNIASPPASSDPAAEGKYLWAVEPDRLPYALEQLPGISLRRGCLTHTNLTAGRAAHAGGEMWFVDHASIVINGGSGRYPPRSADELEAIAGSFRNCGYRVASMGWDLETNTPARYLRGQPQWS